jgi:hypothetical protein
VAVPNWRPAGRLMHFGWLDSTRTLIPAYTVGWRITDLPDDVWTNRFLKLKNGVGVTSLLARACSETPSATS